MGYTATIEWDGPGYYAGVFHHEFGWDFFDVEKVADSGEPQPGEIARERGLGTPRYYETEEEARRALGIA